MSDNTVKPETTAAEPETQTAEPETQTAESETQTAEQETAAEPETQTAAEPETQTAAESETQTAEPKPMTEAEIKKVTKESNKKASKTILKTIFILIVAAIVTVVSEVNSIHSTGYTLLQNIGIINKENAMYVSLGIGKSSYSYTPGITYKPIIYLYPAEDTELTVELGYPEKVTCSYPNYTTGWNVLAKSNGDLIDLDTGRNLYALYYESESAYDFKVEYDGFIVKGEDAAEFLEEKLAILGLSDREAEEFIVYWLPRLQENEYNYIRFATNEEIEENMPLSLSVEPDSLIRVIMTYKALDEPIDIEEQQLETPVREGFTVVEWGGTEIND